MTPGRSSHRLPDGRLELDLGPLMTAMGDGLAELAEAILAEAEPPDAEPFGEGLVTSGGVVSFSFGRREPGEHEAEGARADPKAVDVIVGFAEPGLFQELGTVHHPPQPFLRPAAERVLTGGRVRSTLAARVR